MTIGDLAKRTGLSAHTIRYYERIGLLPGTLRNHAGRRVYDESILPWIDFLGRLRTTGMPIRTMLRYARLRAQGPGTSAARRELLVHHRALVFCRLNELQACLSVLEAKIANYGDQPAENHDETDGSQHQRAISARAAGALRN